MVAAVRGCWSHMISKSSVHLLAHASARPAMVTPARLFLKRWTWQLFNANGLCLLKLAAFEVSSVYFTFALVLPIKCIRFL